MDLLEAKVPALTADPQGFSQILIKVAMIASYTFTICIVSNFQYKLYVFGFSCAYHESYHCHVDQLMSAMLMVFPQYVWVQ